jgi:hypothetical protein
MQQSLKETHQTLVELVRSAKDIKQLHLLRDMAMSELDKLRRLNDFETIIHHKDNIQQEVAKRFEVLNMNPIEDDGTINYTETPHQ